MTFCADQLADIPDLSRIVFTAKNVYPLETVPRNRNSLTKPAVLYIPAYLFYKFLEDYYTRINTRSMLKFISTLKSMAMHYSNIDKPEIEITMVPAI